MPLCSDINTRIHKAREGLVKRQVVVTPKKGMPYKATRWVSADDTLPDKKPTERPLNDVRAEKREDGHKLSDDTVSELMGYEKSIADIPEGKTKTVYGTPVTNLGGGYYGVIMHGKRLVGVGTNIVAVTLHYATVASATGGAFATGDIQGRSVATTEAASRQQVEIAKRGVEKVVNKKSVGKEEKKREGKKA